MSFCPECGGNLHYISITKHHVCKSCGLSLTFSELSELRRKQRLRTESEEEQRERQKKEYLKWWLRSKKEKSS